MVVASHAVARLDEAQWEGPDAFEGEGDLLGGAGEEELFLGIAIHEHAELQYVDELRAPNGDILADAGVTRDHGGHIVTNANMETGVPGIYAAGDVRAQLARQVTTAVGDATTAVIAAEKYIEALAHP